MLRLITTVLVTVIVCFTITMLAGLGAGMHYAKDPAFKDLMIKMQEASKPGCDVKKKSNKGDV